MAMLRVQLDVQKLVAETTGQAGGEHHTRRRTSERVHAGTTLPAQDRERRLAIAC